MRVVTWNVWWRLGDWTRRAAAIAATLEELRPDLVCLQEVWQHGGDSQAAIVADRLGMTSVFARDRTEDGVDQGVALLSRWPLEAVATRTLPAPPDGADPNVALRALVQAPRGPLLLTTTHLIPYLHRSEWRERQIRALIDFVAEARAHATDHHGHTIVAGDFNAPPDSDEIRLLTGRRPPHAPGWVFLDAWETPLAAHRPARRCLTRCSFLPIIRRIAWRGTSATPGGFDGRRPANGLCQLRVDRRVRRAGMG